jgi:hypothetical protein
MRPSFVKQSNFDSEMTRFAGKYTLYLYREKGADSSDQVREARKKQHKRGNKMAAQSIVFPFSPLACLSCSSLVMLVASGRFDQ